MRRALDFARGLAPQPRLIWGVAIGAGLIALAVASPLIGFIATVYNAGLVIIAARDLALLPGRSGYSVRRSMPEPFSLGEPEEVAVVIQNRSAAGLMANVADHAPGGLRPTPRELPGQFDSNGLLKVSYRTYSPRRGAYAFGPVDLQVWREDGWWRRQVRLPDPQEVAVFPNVVAIKRIQLSLRRGLRAMAGMRRARPPGASTAFAGLREYVRGDDVRRVSWTATARRDRPVVVEVEAERGQQMIIALDCGRLMTAPAGDLDKLDHAVNAALMLAWVAQAYGDRVGLMTFDDRVTSFIKPERGPIQLRRITEALYAIRPDYVEPDFGHAMTHLALRVGRRSMIVMLTDVQDPEASRELVAHALRLAARHLVLVVAMSDPAVLSARGDPIVSTSRAYEWAAAEEFVSSRRESFEILRRGGVLGLDVVAGRLSPALVERYLELKERALL
ncbi:MAG: DUF58 domain-containing protein [Chloroflexi bacterium]|nr:MAG: DUF58 domain-containing protein [Chloroflexota bacterium]TME41457.1 MAG: DUF58 domain-containing protein [Chloroflexota bacterium]